MARWRAVVTLFLAVVALAAFAPTFVLVTLTSFGTLGSGPGNALLLLDLGAACGALAAAVLMFRGHKVAPRIALAAGVAGGLAGLAFVFVVWPWSTEGVAMTRLLVLHAWAPGLIAVGLVKPRRAKRRPATLNT